MNPRCWLARSVQFAVALGATAAALEAQSPPAVYDLRVAGAGGTSLVAAVQDQGAIGDCWTFASTTAMDSSLIVGGYFSTGTTAPPIQLSSWHLSTLNGDPQWLTYHNGDYQQPVTGNFSWGGFTWQAMGYAVRGAGSWPAPQAIPGSTTTLSGGGPVLESSNPLNVFPLAAVNNSDNLTPYLPPADQGLPFVTRNVFYFSTQISGGNSTTHQLAVKQAMQQYGALTTYMDANNGFMNGTATTYTTYYSTHTDADHAVTLIGWDDTFQVAGAPNPGAWIVQNSWGTDWTPNNTGIFYAAYDSAVIGKQGITAFVLEPNTQFNSVVLQNQLGPIWQSDDSPGADYPTGLNTLTANLTGNTNMAASVLGITQASTLGAVGLVSQLDGVTANVSFYTGWDANGPTGYLSGYDMVVSFEEAGYTLTDLPAPLALGENSTLVVVVDYNGVTSVIPYDALGTGLGNTTLGLSYYYNGTGWEDFGALGTNPGVFFLKGYTLVPEPGAYALIGALLAVTVALWKRRYSDPRPTLG